MDKIKSQVLIGSLDDVDDEEIIDSPEPSFIKDIIDNIISNAIHKASVYRCCVCMETKEFRRPAYHRGYTTAHSILCQTCNDGKVCITCMSEIDKTGVIWIDDKKKVKKILSCPCCKTINWNYYYEYFIEYGLNYDMGSEIFHDPPAIVLYQRNMEL